MSGPAPESQERGDVLQGLSVEEMEAMSRALAAPDLTKIELGSTNLGTFKGKTASELIVHAKALEDSLRLSEQGRTQAEQLAAIAARQQPVAPVVAAPEPEKLPTDEEIQRLYDENPVAPIKVMAERAAKIAAQSFQARLEPLMASSTVSAETTARAKYAEEFSVLGDQIQDVVKMIPNAKQALTNPAAWDDIIAYVRGKPGNFERLVEAKAAKQAPVQAQQAHQQQQANVGFQPAPTGRSGIYRSDGSPDPVAMEIAEKTGLTWAEYVQWSKVG